MGWISLPLLTDAFLQSQERKMKRWEVPLTSYPMNSYFPVQGKHPTFWLHSLPSHTSLQVVRLYPGTVSLMLLACWLPDDKPQQLSGWGRSSFLLAIFFCLRWPAMSQSN